MALAAISADIVYFASSNGPGAHFINSVFIAIQIRWKFRFAVIPVLINISLQVFAHATTALLSWHVQKFVAMTHCNLYGSNRNFHRILVTMERTLVKWSHRVLLTIIASQNRWGDAGKHLLCQHIKAWINVRNFAGDISRCISLYYRYSFLHLSMFWTIQLKIIQICIRWCVGWTYPL